MIRVHWASCLLGLLVFAGACSSGSSGSSAPDAAAGSGGSAAVGGSGGGGAVGAADAGAGDADAALPVACQPGSKAGPAGGSETESTAGGVSFYVRTPSAYDPTLAHPLLVVYAPAGVSSPAQTESHSGLTAEAVGRGYIVAYANHASPSQNSVVTDLGTIGGLVAQSWCVDVSRVYFTGHSDGGSVATLLALAGTTPPARAIAPSAAGINQNYVNASTCPGAIPVMVLHSKNDTLFPPPDFGLAPANFWAACASCGAQGTTVGSCTAYSGCAPGTEVLYCETAGSHGAWPGLNTEMLDFFDRAK